MPEYEKWQTTRALLDLDLFVEVCLYGVAYASHAHETAEILTAATTGEPLDRVKLPDALSRRATKLQTFAREQASADFPKLFELATVHLWSILEAGIDDLMLERLSRPEALPDDAVLADLQGSLLQFLSATPEERATLLYERLQIATRSSHQPGIARFEALLDPIGLKGPVDPAARRALIELAEVRHVIVHRGSRADAKLIDRCPWLNATLGNSVHTDHLRFTYYFKAALWYALEIRRRVGEFEDDDRERLVALQLELAETVVSLRKRCDAPSET